MWCRRTASNERVASESDISGDQARCASAPGSGSGHAHQRLQLDGALHQLVGVLDDVIEKASPFGIRRPNIVFSWFCTDVALPMSLRAWRRVSCGSAMKAPRIGMERDLCRREIPRPPDSATAKRSPQKNLRGAGKLWRESFYRHPLSTLRFKESLLIIV
jgi:hypothetical protein